MLGALILALAGAIDGATFVEQAPDKAGRVWTAASAGWVFLVKRSPEGLVRGAATKGPALVHLTPELLDRVAAKLGP